MELQNVVIDTTLINIKFIGRLKKNFFCNTLYFF